MSSLSCERKRSFSLFSSSCSLFSIFRAETINKISAPKKQNYTYKRAHENILLLSLLNSIFVKDTSSCTLRITTLPFLSDIYFHKYHMAGIFISSFANICCVFCTFPNSSKQFIQNFRHLDNVFVIRFCEFPFLLLRSSIKIVAALTFPQFAFLNR